MKGALDVVLKLCASLPDGSPLTSIDQGHYENAARDFGLRGLRGQRSAPQYLNPMCYFDSGCYGKGI